MPNIESVFKSGIGRVARKEIRRETVGLKKHSANHRSEIAALKRRMLELERQLRQIGREQPSAAPVAANEDSGATQSRFSAKSMASHRKRLGLSAADCVS